MRLNIEFKASTLIFWALLPFLAGCLEQTDQTAGITASDPPPTSANNPPTISGKPDTTVTMGNDYSFIPTAKDADGDSLTFIIDNKPSWIVFDKTNGSMTGMPTLGDVGTYPNIVVSVSDGTAKASLNAFQIEVVSDSAPPPPPPPPTEPPPPPSSDYVGFGAATKGASSCPTTAETYHVTSLSGGSGAGTLRDAVSQDCRYIAFDVAGNINLGDLQISRSYLTIDGSTAPSPGITLVNVGRVALEASGGQAVHDVIVNNIRAIGQGGAVETNDLWELDGSSGAPIYNVVLDHLTMSKSGDGNVDIYGNVHDITLSNSLIMDSIQGHHFSQSGALRERISIYKNVYARLNERQPRIRYDTRQLDYVGNVIYGWGWFEGGAAGMNIDAGSGTPSANVEKNIYHFVSGLNGSADDALKIDSFAGSWFFDQNTWPTGETQGDTAGNSGRISMLYQGIDYSLPREVTDIVSAGTHYPTSEESQLLSTISDAVTAGSGGGTPPPPPPPPPAGQSQFRGIPEPSDVLGFDVWADYQASKTITGMQGVQTISCPGTAANPCVVDASGATFSITSENAIVLSGPYAILQGGKINVTAGVSGYFLEVCSNCVVRDVELAGPGINVNNSTAVGMANNSVWIRGSVHGFGQNSTSAAENDFHGFKPCGQNNVWILGVDAYDLSGDGVQAGDATRCSASNIYIGGGTFHDNRENGVDIKDSTNVVVSGSEMWGFSSTAENGPNPAVVIHDDAKDAKVYDSVIHNTLIGLYTSGLSGPTFNANDITASQTGIVCYHTSGVNITGNTISAPTKIDADSTCTGTIQ